MICITTMVIPLIRQPSMMIVYTKFNTIQVHTNTYIYDVRTGIKDPK